MRDVVLYMSMSLDGFVSSDREHPGAAIPEGAELKRWKLDHISRAGAHLMGRITYQERFCWSLLVNAPSPSMAAQRSPGLVTR